MKFSARGLEDADWRNLLSRTSSSPAPTSTESLDGELRLAAQVRGPVLITAEGRNRREMCARLIHANGSKAQCPFVVFASDAAGASAQDSDIPSAARSPDDGARLRQQFDKARGGTLFIDDIARLTQDAQAQLFRLLEEYRPLQASTAHAVSPGVRVIAGASRHLDAERAAGAFCERLFYRLNVLHIDLRPRRQSTERP